MEQIEASIEAMPVSERREFVRWFDQHRHELLPGIENAQQAEVLTRLAETDANPALLESFEEADVKRMFKEFADARCSTPSASPTSAA